jgi:hypothetical protein
MPHRIALTCALVVALLAGAFVLHQYPPGEGSVYPACLLHKVTGWYCPGCGATRCVSALLHGDVASALRMNALMVAALPFLGIWLVQAWWSWFTKQSGKTGMLMPKWLAVTLVFVVLAFGALRNLPWAPFRWLAPH